jgi:hypothetical protein
MARATVLRPAWLTRVRERRGADLAGGRAEARPRGLDALARCARGLPAELPAVTAGRTLAWRHGVTEGPSQRLPRVQRQGDGRAGGARRRQRLRPAASGRHGTRPP